MSGKAMSLPVRNWKEADRLQVIEDYGILDTPREDDYDDIAHLAAQIWVITDMTHITFGAWKR